MIISPSMIQDAIERIDEDDEEMTRQRNLYRKAFLYLSMSATPDELSDVLEMVSDAESAA